ncbi:MAG: histidine phosphatase family protein [Acidobacteria bacterium]|jgi:broad specificity phosphatase PhoE|nr:histidine phosphatase family protein [Acidobacteriota bacterium]
MKIIFSLLLGLLLFTFAGNSVFAQHRKLTVILLRHAEKDVSENADSANPELSAAGKLRAEKLVDVIGKYHPDAIYSTDYIRTRATARPLARKLNMLTLIYDERNLSQMNDLIMSGKFKRIVVVGHNTTTPALANMLIKEDKYKRLGENEYDKIWIVKIRKYKRKPNKVKEKVITY